MKMPEPSAWQGAHDSTDLYYRKPAQGDVKPLYDKQALIDLLEEALKECMASKLIDTPTRHEIAVVRKCAIAIRKLKETL